MINFLLFFLQKEMRSDNLLVNTCTIYKCNVGKFGFYNWYTLCESRFVLKYTLHYFTQTHSVYSKVRFIINLILLKSSKESFGQSYFKHNQKNSTDKIDNSSKHLVSKVWFCIYSSFNRTSYGNTKNSNHVEK